MLTSSVYLKLDRETLANQQLVKRGGGLGVYYNPVISCDSDVYGHKNVSNRDLELQILQFTRSNARKVVLFNVYRPRNGSTQVAIDLLNEAIFSIPQVARKDIVVLGDFNIDMLDTRHRDAKALKVRLRWLGLFFSAHANI